jgi:hypothetical protein
MPNPKKTLKSGDALVLPGVDESIVALPDGSKSKPSVDWERIEVEYRAGTRSVREIAADHGISHTAINKRKNAEGWTRDLQGKIKSKADALVSKAMVSKEVSMETAITEKITIEVEAQVQSRIRLAHRSDVSRFRSLSIKLLDELELTTDNKELLEQLGYILRSEDKNGQDKRNDLYNKVIGMPQRVDSMKKLSETLKVLIELERKAYGIDSDKQTAGDKLDDLLAMLDGKTSSLLPE